MATQRRRQESYTRSRIGHIDGHLTHLVCGGCLRQVEPGLAELAARHGEQVTLLDFAARPVCSRCGNKRIASVGSGGCEIKKANR